MNTYFLYEKLICTDFIKFITSNKIIVKLKKQAVSKFSKRGKQMFTSWLKSTICFESNVGTSYSIQTSLNICSQYRFLVTSRMRILLELKLSLAPTIQVGTKAWEIRCCLANVPKLYLTQNLFHFRLYTTSTGVHSKM